MRKTGLNGQLRNSFTSTELYRFCDVAETRGIEPIEQGVLEPKGPVFKDWYFQDRNSVNAMKARRLQRDFGFITAGSAKVLDIWNERAHLVCRLSTLNTD